MNSSEADSPARKGGNPGKRYGKKLSLAAVVAFLLVVVLTAEQILNIGIIERLELASLDLRYQLRGPRLTSDNPGNIVIVEISRESFESLPERWPWPRSYYARLVRNLERAGARAVGIDVIFVDDDTNPESDIELKNAIRETGIVVLAGRLEIDNRSYEVIKGSENYGNVFFDVDRSLGFVNVLRDPDEVVRRYVPSAGHIPSFGFSLLNKQFGLPPLTLPERESGSFRIADRLIPAYDGHSLLINYYGPSRSFPHVDFADVIDDESFETVEEQLGGISINMFSDPDFGYLYDDTFRDKIVLVGSTLPEDQDVHQVAIGRGEYTGDNTMFGVEIHANLLESVLRRDFLSSQSILGEILTIFVLTFLTFFATSALKSSKTSHHTLVEVNGVLFAIVVLAVFAFISIRLFIDVGYVMATISPMLAVAGGYVASTAYHFVRERRERVMIKGMFSTYLSPSLVEQLVADPARLKLGGERKELTVLFSDLEGFTALAETKPPEELVSLLNEYLSSMTQVVLQNHGTLDKFEGDLIMAFWGAPLPQNDHAVRACRAALQMQAKLSSMRLEWGLRKRPLLTARIGINTGEMVVGNMGSLEKFNYTVIGDSVNLGSRLEGANKIYRSEVIISESCYVQVQHEFLCRDLDILAVRGRSEPVCIYELICPAAEADQRNRDFVTAFEGGLKAYRERNWQQAKTLLEEALSLRRADYPVEVYLERIRRYEQNPPADGWKGVHVPQA